MKEEKKERERERKKEREGGRKEEERERGARILKVTDSDTSIKSSK
jgi:hypothetical protein